VVVMMATVTDEQNRQQDYPAYKPGLYACLVTAVANLVIVVILTVHAYIENKKADRGEKELETDDVSDILPEEVIVTDHLQENYQPGFRYTY
jgi:hypothetical protein